MGADLSTEVPADLILDEDEENVPEWDLFDEWPSCDADGEEEHGPCEKYAVLGEVVDAACGGDALPDASTITEDHATSPSTPHSSFPDLDVCRASYMTWQKHGIRPLHYEFSPD